MQFYDYETKDILQRATDKGKMLATFGFGQAKFQDDDAKEFATRALGMPVSLEHLEKAQDDDHARNMFDQKFMANLRQARLTQSTISWRKPETIRRPFDRRR